MPNIPVEIVVSHSEEAKNKLTEDYIDLNYLTKKNMSTVLSESGITLWNIIRQCNSRTSKLYFK